MTQVDFEVHGPFPMELRGNDEGVPTGAGEFWSASKELQGLASKRGCYVFGVQSGKARTPHYVGLTKRRFDREVFNPSNMKKYGRARKTTKSGKAFLFLIVHPSFGAAPTRDTKRAINEAENFLIQAA